MAHEGESQVLCVVAIVWLEWVVGLAHAESSTRSQLLFAPNVVWAGLVGATPHGRARCSPIAHAVAVAAASK